MNNEIAGATTKVAQTDDRRIALQALEELCQNGNLEHGKAEEHGEAAEEKEDWMQIFREDLVALLNEQQYMRIHNLTWRDLVAMKPNEAMKPSTVAALSAIAREMAGQAAT